MQYSIFFLMLELYFGQFYKWKRKEFDGFQTGDKDRDSFRLLYMLFRVKRKYKKISENNRHPLMRHCPLEDNELWCKSV